MVAENENTCCCCCKRQDKGNSFNNEVLAINMYNDNKALPKLINGIKF